MNSLKRKRELYRLQSLPALTRFEVCDKLQPLVVQLGLTFTENEICFPQPLCDQQRIVYICACCEKLYEKSIRFSDVIYMKNNHESTCAVLRTGHAFYFFNDCKFWYIYNVLGYGEPTHITVWWWKLTAYFLLRWRKLFTGNTSSHKI